MVLDVRISVCVCVCICSPLWAEGCVCFSSIMDVLWHHTWSFCVFFALWLTFLTNYVTEISIFTVSHLCLWVIFRGWGLWRGGTMCVYVCVCARLGAFHIVDEWKGCHFIFVYFVVCIVADLVLLFDKFKRKSIDFIISPFISVWDLPRPQTSWVWHFFTLTYNQISIQFHF